MRLQVCTDAMPERDRIPCWHDAICHDMFNVTAGPVADIARFRAKLDVQVAGRFTVADLECSDGGVVRTAGNLARGAADSVLVCLARKSGQQYRIGSYEYDLTPGDVGILPMDQPFENAGGDVAFRSLLIPNAVLRPLLAERELTRPYYLGAGTPLGVLLSTSVNAAAAQLPHLTHELGDAALTALCGLVALASGASEEGHAASQESVRAARLLAVKRHIGRHLSDPMLDPAAVAIALKISVRQLHLLFQPTGDTFSRYLLRRRLDACRATLSSPAALGRSVADVAFGWGFNSLSVFYRAFAAAFADSPAGLREAMAVRATRQEPETPQPRSRARNN